MTNEKRLIDVNKVIDEMQKCIDESPCERDSVASYTFGAIIECLKQEPTVDAVEVVHGHWSIFDDGFGCELVSCSVCKAEFYDGDNDTVDHLHNYCPNCGAKMDGDGRMIVSKY